MSRSYGLGASTWQETVVGVAFLLWLWFSPLFYLWLGLGQGLAMGLWWLVFLVGAAGCSGREARRNRPRSGR